ncbi:MAG: hypothetical protein HKN47_13895 [Pirellulaceae bacterium]|nr:hypothetical protein [Pirellulaceae bacterium]
MRRSFFGILAVILATGISTGCRQTTGTVQSGLTPVSPLSSTNQLAPVRSASAIGPFGGSTRVPPPPTGGYSVPNNYMGGASPYGQTSNNQINSGGFASNGQSGGWTQSGANTFASPGNSFNANANIQNQMAIDNIGQPIAASGQRPQSGGMRVIDMTAAPAPPGYRPSNVNNQNSMAYQAPVQNFGGNSNQFANNQFANNQYPGPSGVATTNYNQGFGANGGVAPTGSVQQSGAYRPINSGDAAGGNFNNFSTQPNVAQAFSGSTGASAPNPPSTAPIGSGLNQQNDGLSWRRPDMQ